MQYTSSFNFIPVLTTRL
ncbi:CRISPR-associated DxTHG motif protein [Ornithobacterium rhinotracheale]|nr:CRISPR-associated DxTHG motif protein [Ornithobacterium rhinotracheale]